MSSRRRTTALCAIALAGVLTTCATPARAAGPDPTIAAMLSTTSTLVPIGLTTALWLDGRGTDEGLRFDLGMTFLGLGAIFGPSMGQIYAEGGGDAWLSLFLRAITGSVMATGAGLWIRGESSKAQSSGRVLSFVGGVPTLLLAIYDIFDARANAREGQARRGHGYTASLPMIEEIGDLSPCSAVRGVGGHGGVGGFALCPGSDAGDAELSRSVPLQSSALRLLPDPRARLLLDLPSPELLPLLALRSR